MPRNILLRGAALACSVLALAGLSASAGDKKDGKAKPALTGVWVLKGGEMKLEFCDKDVLKLSPHGDSDVVVVVCRYKVEKDKRVKSRVTELEGKAKEKAREVIPVGLEFSFTWQVKDGIATLGDVKGKKVELLKSHLEGQYERKK
jgi:hypothetical protein